MKVVANQPVPDFQVEDVYGNPVSLRAFRGHKIHVTFYRFSGCPNCNLRFHEVNKLEALYCQQGVVQISVYESSVENMKAHIADDTFYSVMMPDPTGALYRLYGLERSISGLFNYLLFHGGIGEFMAEKKLFRQVVESDGHADRLEAEFLIQANGQVAVAHYNKRQGDFLPVSVLKAFATG